MFDVAPFEGLSQSTTQSFGVGRIHLQGFFASLEPEVRGGEAVLAGHVDEGAPFGVGDILAHLYPRRRHPVSHDPIVPEDCRHLSRRTSSPGAQQPTLHRYKRSSSSAKRIQPTTLQG